MHTQSRSKLHMALTSFRATYFFVLSIMSMACLWNAANAWEKYSFGERVNYDDQHWIEIHQTSTTQQSRASEPFEIRLSHAGKQMVIRSTTKTPGWDFGSTIYGVAWQDQNHIWIWA